MRVNFFRCGVGVIGRVFANRYRIVDVLSEGGMGTVYLAEHLRIGRQVALKRLHPELASNAKAVVRFQREARAAASTLHDNIIDVFDLGYDDDGAPFLVMEYLRGESLAETLLREGRISEIRAIRIVSQVLDALSAVHRKNIIHRDLKPENIFLTQRSGQADFVKLLDFGVSKILSRDEDSMELTRTGVMLGTPYYMSPEQARGSDALDHRVDIYAVGVILYESLANRMPFDGPNYHALLQAIVANCPTPLQKLNPDVSTRLAKLVHRAMAASPQDRFDSAEAMLSELSACGDTAEETAKGSAGASTAATINSAHLGFSSDIGTEMRLSDKVALQSLGRTVGYGSNANSRASNYAAVALGHPQFITALHESVSPYASRSGPAAALQPQPVHYADSMPVPTASPSQNDRTAARPIATATTSQEVRGIVLAGAVRHLEEQFGGASLMQLRSVLPADLRQTMEGIIMPVAWFPLALLEQLLRFADSLLGHSNGALARSMGAAIASTGLPVLKNIPAHGFDLREGIDLLKRLSATLYQPCGLHVVEIDPRCTELTFEDMGPTTHLHGVVIASLFENITAMICAQPISAELLAPRAVERTMVSIRLHCR